MKSDCSEEQAITKEDAYNYSRDLAIVISKKFVIFC